MKYLHIQILISLLLISCSSPEKLLLQGNYDALINKSVKKIIKGKHVSENAELMDKAYKLANQRDLERINYLKTEGNPDTWDEIHSLYSRLNYRQSLVKKVVPLNVGNVRISYEFEDYGKQIADAKRNAADYYYNHAKKLMENGDKESYRLAYNELFRAKNYAGGNTYSDIDQLISDCKYFGTTRVLITSINNSYVHLPNEFMHNLLDFNRAGLNNNWIEYHLRQMDREMIYDYYIDIHLQFVEVSQGTITEIDHEYRKRVEDGFTYVFDRRGNVMKDSLGNDIKVPKYKDLKCTVIEKIKEKSAILKGEIEFSSSNPKQIIAREPIAAKSQFQDISFRAVGDIEVLNPEQRNQLLDREVPFPEDLSMIYNTAEAFKNSISDVVKHNKSYIK